MQKETIEFTLTSLQDLFKAVEEHKAELRKLRSEFVERKTSEAANVSISAVVETPDELEKMLETLGRFSCKPTTVSVETREPVQPFIVDTDTFEVSLRGASIKVDGVQPEIKKPGLGCPRPPAGHNLQAGEPTDSTVYTAAIGAQPDAGVPTYEFSATPTEAPDAARIAKGFASRCVSVATSALPDQLMPDGEMYMLPPGASWPLDQPPPPPVDAFTTMTYGSAPNLMTVAGRQGGQDMQFVFAQRPGGMAVARRTLDRQEAINLYRHIGQWLKDTGDEALHPG